MKIKQDKYGRNAVANTSSSTPGAYKNSYGSWVTKSTSTPAKTTTSSSSAPKTTTTSSSAPKTITTSSSAPKVSTSGSFSAPKTTTSSNNALNVMNSVGFGNTNPYTTKANTSSSNMMSSAGFGNTNPYTTKASTSSNNTSSMMSSAGFGNTSPYITTPKVNTSSSNVFGIGNSSSKSSNSSSSSASSSNWATPYLNKNTATNAQSIGPIKSSSNSSYSSSSSDSDIPSLTNSELAKGYVGTVKDADGNTLYVDSSKGTTGGGSTTNTTVDESKMTDNDKRFAGLLPPNNNTTPYMMTKQEAKAAQQEKDNKAWTDAFAKTKGTKEYDLTHPSIVTNTKTGEVVNRFNLGGSNYVDLNPKTGEVVRSMSKIGTGQMMTTDYKTAYEDIAKNTKLTDEQKNQRYQNLSNEVSGLTSPILKTLGWQGFIGGGTGNRQIEDPYNKKGTWNPLTGDTSGEIVQTADAYTFAQGTRKASGSTGGGDGGFVTEEIKTRIPVGMNFDILETNKSGPMGFGGQSVGPRMNMSSRGFTKQNKLKDFATEFFSRKWGA